MSEWVKIGSSWYYFKSNGAVAYKQWVKGGNTWYYLKSNGAMALSEWVKIEDTWCYFKASGEMAASEWIESGDSKYYLKASGAMAFSEWIKIDNIAYYFDENGIVTRSLELTADGQYQFGIRTYEVKEGNLVQTSGYYDIQSEIILPEERSYLWTDNIGIKTLYVNQYLIDHGYLNAYSTNTARYSYATYLAVCQFQRDNGLTVDGSVGKSTWKAMGYNEEDYDTLGKYVTPLKVTSEAATTDDYVNAMVETAKEYANAGTVYMIGASGNPGTWADCSGLIYQCLYSAGINPTYTNSNIVSHAYADFEYTSRLLEDDEKLGMRVSLDDIEIGDLIFYCNDYSNVVIHVAIYAGDGMIYDSWPGVGVTNRSMYIAGTWIKTIIRVF